MNTTQSPAPSMIETLTLDSQGQRTATTDWIRRPTLLAAYLMTLALTSVWALTSRRQATAANVDNPAGEDTVEGAASSDNEAGLTSLEIAVIALGLFVLAGVLVAAVSAAVQSRTDQIN